MFEGFDLSGMSDTDYTDTFADMDENFERIDGLIAAISSDCAWSVDQYDKDGVGLIFTAVDDDGDPLGSDDYGNTIVRLDIDMRNARDVRREDGSPIITPPPYQVIIVVDLSRGNLARFIAGRGFGWSLQAGRLLNRGTPVDLSHFPCIKLRFRPTQAGDLVGAPAAVKNIAVNTGENTRSLNGAPRRLDGKSSLTVWIDDLPSLDGAPEYVGGSVKLAFDGVHVAKDANFLSGLPRYIGGDLEANYGVIPMPKADLTSGACTRILPAGQNVTVCGKAVFLNAPGTMSLRKGRAETIKYRQEYEICCIDNPDVNFRDATAKEKMIIKNAMAGINAPNCCVVTVWLADAPESAGQKKN